LDASLADAAFPAFFGAVPTILAVLAGVARIGTSAGGGKNIEWNLIDEKNGQHDLSEGGKHLLFQHHKILQKCLRFRKVNVKWLKFFEKGALRRIYGDKGLELPIILRDQSCR